MTTLVKEESSLVMVALVASMVVVHMSVSRRDVVMIEVITI